MKLASSILILSSMFQSCNGFSLNPQTQVSRRDAFTNAASGILGSMIGLSTVLPNVAVAYPAEETPRVVNRMGGLLVSEGINSPFAELICMLRLFCCCFVCSHHDSFQNTNWHRKNLQTVEEEYPFLLLLDGINLKERLEHMIWNGKILLIAMKILRFPVHPSSPQRPVCKFHWLIWLLF